MAIATFDTLKFANTLKAAGVPDKQAEAEANAFAEIIQIQVKDLATKADLDRQSEGLNREIGDSKKDLKQEIAEVRKDLKQEIAEVRKDLKQEIAEVRKDLKQEIADLRKEVTSDIEVLRAKMTGEFLLLKWMITALITGVMAMVIRMFFMRGAM